MRGPRLVLDAKPARHARTAARDRAGSLESSKARDCKLYEPIACLDRSSSSDRVSHASLTSRISLLERKASSTSARLVRGLFELRPGPPQRWLFALRAALCMGTPILVGSWLGDVSAGLMACLGAFTSLYGSGRPYVYRALELGAIALAFAVCVGFGMFVAPNGLAVIVVVPAIAMLATWLSNALHIGPPGAYMFTLACASATAMPAAHIDAGDAALLVLAGGAFAWIVHLSGAMFAPRRPERRAVSSAGKAVVAYLQAIGTAQEGPTRHRAALALHEAWSVLVNQQPLRARSDGMLGRLRAVNRELHLRFADGLGTAARNEPLRAELIAEASALAAQANRPHELPPAPEDAIPLGRPRAIDAAFEALTPGSSSMRVIVRVGIAALSAGILAAMFHLERAYWAVAATVLVLHQGFDWVRMLQRSVERLIGTWLGLVLAGAILLVHPQGVWLALTVMILQFTIEIFVIRNYALAAIFITGAALTIASGGQAIDSPGGYLLARGVDTFVGCALALIVFRLIPPQRTALRIPLQLEGTLTAVARTVEHLASGAVTTLEAKTARRELQRASFALAHAYEEGLSASSRERRAAERAWPAIAATERLAYRTLSLCWALERIGGEAAREAASSMFGNDGAERIRLALAELAAAIRTGATPEPLHRVPHALEVELANLRDCLVREPLAAI